MTPKTYERICQTVADLSNYGDLDEADANLIVDALTAQVEVVDQANKAKLAEHGLVFEDSDAGRLADLRDAVEVRPPRPPTPQTGMNRQWGGS